MKPKNLARVLAIGMLLAVLLSAFKVPGFGRAATNANPIQNLWLYGRDAVSDDALVNSANPTTNYGSFQQLYISYNGANCPLGAGGQCKTLIRPNIAAIPAGATVVDAEMFLYLEEYRGGSQNNASQFYVLNNITGSWAEGTVTWNNQPSLQSWSCTGPAGVIVICDSGTISQYQLGQYISIQITGQVKNWFSGATTNNGIEIAMGGEASFISREATLGGVNAPKMLIVYQMPAATIYPAYYCTGGPCETGILSGSGLPPTLFNVTYAENNSTFRRAPRPDLLLTNLSTYYTLRVSDFFGNFLYNASKVVTSTTFVWIVAIPYGIFQVYSMRDTFTSLSIKPAGGTAMVIDIPPRAWWALPLKSQVAYWLNFTILDANFNAIATINIIRTMGTKLSFIVNGTTLSQISMNQNGNWETTNLTRGSTYAIGNIMSAPHGIDLFQNYWTLHAWGVPIPVTLWLISVIVLGISWGGWGFTYRGKLGRRIHRWPRKAKLISGFILIPLSSTLLVALIVHLAGGSVFIPIPWAPITSMIPGLAFVVPVDTDPDDPGNGGGDGDGDGKGDPHDVKGPDIYVRVLHEDDDLVRLLVTLTQGARAQFRERGVDWLEDVLRDAVRRSFADHPLHRPFRRTGHVDPRPPGEHGGNGEARGFDR